MVIDVFKELNRDILSLIRKTYLMDPIRYAYLYYDIIYYPEFTEAYLNTVGNEVIGYLLIYRGLPRTAVHIVGNMPTNILEEIPLNTGLDVHIEAEPKYINHVMNELAKRGTITRLRALTMVCWSNSFREFKAHEGLLRRLSINDVKELLRVKELQGARISEVEALLRLVSLHWHYYGLFINNELVSIATAYLKLPEVWVVGDVFTVPNYRNRGFAKAVTSAVTRDAVNSGAMAMLHVLEDNDPAVKVYRRLGYVTVQVLTRLIYNPH